MPRPAESGLRGLIVAEVPAPGSAPGRLLVAKAGVFAAVSLVVGEVVSFLAFFLGQSIMSGRAPHATLSQPFVLRAVFGAGR